MEFSAKKRWFDRPVVYTMPCPVDLRRGDHITVSGLVNGKLNGEYTVTKVRRHWLHWYDPVVVFFQWIGLQFKKLLWRLQACLEHLQRG